MVEQVTVNHYMKVQFLPFPPKPQPSVEAQKLSICLFYDFFNKWLMI